MNILPNVAMRKLAWLAAILACAGSVHAQSDKPITLVVPFTAGSATDVIARIISEPLAKALGQTVIVANRPGAGGTLGAAYVASAAADGATMLVHSAGHVANAALYPDLAYDPRTALVPVAMLATLPNVLLVSSTSGIATLEALVQKARDNPKRLNYASAGTGSATHINAEKFRQSAQLDALHIPYRGTPQALLDVVSGNVDWAFAPVVSSLSLIHEGKLVPLAVGSAQRAAGLPNVPTTLEKGFAGSDYAFWIGLLLPADTPADVMDRVAVAAQNVLQDADVRSALARLSAQPGTLTREAFAAQVLAEFDSIAALIKGTGIQTN